MPAAIVLYPLVRRVGTAEFDEDESSVSAELTRRWESAVAGLRAAELEASIGNLTEEDHRWLTEQYTAEAAMVMKAMDLEEQQEEELLRRMMAEVQLARTGHLGPSAHREEGRTLKVRIVFALALLAIAATWAHALYGRSAVARGVPTRSRER